MKQYNEIVDEYLKKGYKPPYGTQPKLSEIYTEEELLLKLTSLQKWLRETKNIHVEIASMKNKDGTREFTGIIKIPQHVNFTEGISNYENTLLQAIKKSINYI